MTFQVKIQSIGKWASGQVDGWAGHLFVHVQRERTVGWGYRPVVDWPSRNISADYGYGARVVYKPYAGRDDVVDEYQRWRH